MDCPVVLHGSSLDSVDRLGKAVAARLGGTYRACGQQGESLLRVIGNGGHAVFGVSSEVLLDRELRVRCLCGGVVVWVQGDDKWSLGPTEHRGGMVSGGAATRVSDLVGREFREAHLAVRGGEGDVEGALREIERVVRRRPVVVAAEERSYLVEVGRGILEERLRERELRAAVALYVTDENVQRLHGARLEGAVAAMGSRVERVVLTPGEESKSLKTLGSIFETALAAGVDRSSWVVAAGGGVVSDLSGLVAALWMRGLRWIGLPTTLLAMVDASVGGKTAIDFGLGKNAVGAFWQPTSVICDVEVLRTESDRNYIGALSEVVKTALIGDAALFELLEKESEAVKSRDLDLMAEVVRRCVQVKAEVVGLDEREGGLRAVLNLGHTVGHALEALGEYRRYTHGEAVSLGLVAALRLGVKLGHTPADLAERVESLLGVLGLPRVLPVGELVGASELLGHDKKRAGSSLGFAFAESVGSVRMKRVVLEELREHVCELASAR